MTPFTQPVPTPYQFDPADPRAPTEAEWAQMTLEERARVVAMLPSAVPEELMPPEGDRHILGIREYFIFDCGNLRLTGYRLPGEPVGSARVYRPIVPQGGRYTSEVLGLEVQVDGQRLRFLHDGEPLPDDDELIAALTGRVDGLVVGHRAAVAEVEAARAQAQAAEQRASSAEQRVSDLQRQLEAAQAELRWLRGRSP